MICMKFDVLLERLRGDVVVIVGGMHGDETAGNLAAEKYKQHAGVVVINNINPSNKRRLNGKDINRHFDVDSTTPLNDSILRNILEHDPMLVIDLHEDVDARGVYAYCSKDLSDEVQYILRAHDLPLAKSACGDAATAGVIQGGDLPSKGTLERALTKRNIPYCTFETPTAWKLSKRVQVLCSLVDAMMQEMQ